MWNRNKNLKKKLNYTFKIIRRINDINKGNFFYIAMQKNAVEYDQVDVKLLLSIIPGFDHNAFFSINVFNNSSVECRYFYYLN